MSTQKHVLVVTNSASDAEVGQIKQAIDDAEKKGLKIRLSLVHVIPTLPTCYFNIPSMVLLAERYYEEAKQCLNYVGDMLNVTQKDQWLMTGKIRSEVLRLSSKLNTHFILASSTSIQDLHKSFLFKKERSATPIKSIKNLNIVLND